MAVAEKRVALIGCGAVGGYIAFELARLGVGNLLLIDPQRLGVENTFRHVLGKKAIGLQKATALRDELLQCFPYMRVKASTNYAELALEAGDIRTEDFDLIIVAVGEISLSFLLNHYFYIQSGVPPVLYTWVEAYGIGGHALLTLNGSRTGCFECLHTPPADGTTMCDRSSFAAPGQSFAKNLSGCAGLFTPFSSLDALRTAILAVEVAGNTLMGNVAGNPLLSWKGCPDAFISAGHSVSDRYSLSAQDLLEGRYRYPSPRCPVCGGKDSDA